MKSNKKTKTGQGKKTNNMTNTTNDNMPNNRKRKGMKEDEE